MALSVLDLKVDPGLEKILLVLFMRSFLVPSNLPANQAIVIQQLSIGQDELMQ